MVFDWWHVEIKMLREKQLDKKKNNNNNNNVADGEDSTSNSRERGR
jgi:hypothetical protein